MKYYLNRNDSEFSDFARRFKNNFADIAAELNFNEAEIAELESSVEAFETDSVKQAEARRVLSSSTVKKNSSKIRAKTAIRNITRKLRANAKVTNQQLALLDLSVRDEVLSRQNEPEGAPLLQIEIKRKGLHKIEVRKGDFSRGKPETAVGAEIWVYIGERNDLTEKNIRYLGTATRLKFQTEHDAEDVGKTAHYIARWINRRGIRGEWSVTVSATIAE